MNDTTLDWTVMRERERGKGEKEQGRGGGGGGRIAVTDT